MSTQPWHDQTLPLPDRVAAAVAALTPGQLTALALADYTVLDSLGLPPLSYRDGPSGVRDIPSGTALPVAMALAATMDTDLAHAYGAAIGAEVAASGHTVLLGPSLDLVRTALAGRIPETFGEDPWLAGHIGLAHIRGVQSRHVIAVAKHLVANTHERGRTGDGHLFARGDAVDMRIDERTLHELYLAPFRRVLADGGAWAVMASYNRLNGRYPSQDPDLWHLVKDEWRWPGFTVPDFIFAVRDPAQALAAGLDVPGLDGPSGRTAEMLADSGRCRDIATRILTAVLGCDLASTAGQPQPDSNAHDLLAATVAADASVLLTNNGVLPLRNITEIAVIGCAGTDALYTVGGSGGVDADPTRIVTPLAGLRARAAGRISVTHAQGTLGDTALPAVPAQVLTQPDGRPGVLAEYHDTDGVLILQTTEQALGRHGPPDGVDGAFTARYTTRLTPRSSGRHRFSLTGGGHATLYIDGRAATTGTHEADRMFAGPGYSRHAVVDLVAGQPIDVEVTYAYGPALDLPFLGIRPGVRLGWQEPDDLIADAAAAAAHADVAVVVVQAASGEAMDRTGLDLPGDQDELIAAVAAANQNTVVVLNTPGPVLMPWLEHVAAVVQVWYPGQRFGQALAAVLFGDADPAGRLPITFPADAGQGPVTTPAQMPGVDGSAVHPEGPLIGYRHFRHHGRRPLFAFGHGLSYASYTYGPLAVSASQQALTVTIPVTNTADRPGTETVQLYITAPEGALQPYPQFKGVAKLRISAGATATATISVALRDLAAYQPGIGWQVHPGTYCIEVGTSSADLQFHARFQLTADLVADVLKGQNP
ncbi:glycoside hydrolase family 3 protein [Hamadaea tsunoensis]|uniref:glycoside hydrolase family 3 protein n=1 Tax=Hamadaea tsunoensis TaxID=53368 RepID=UPI0004029186|nr:glycoside hydrolase family 3 C-terminal domain-containing protein [Hamadaea tsunoensis]